MPLLRLQTSPAVPEVKVHELSSALSKLVSEVTHKPEKYVMIVIEPASILMSGKPGDAAFVDVRGIGGLDVATNRDMTRRLSELLRKLLDIPADRVYITFSEFDPSHWGWNNSTFG
jgi:phenylpyruvate tautomerase